MFLYPQRRKLHRPADKRREAVRHRALHLRDPAGRPGGDTAQPASAGGAQDCQ